MSSTATVTTQAAPKAAPAAPGRTLQRKCSCGNHTPGGGECEECKRKKGTLQRRPTGDAAREDVPPIVDEVLGSPGRPLDPATRTFMESRLGHDFGGVRLHTSAAAAESAEAVRAEAYTVGRDIVFGAGQYAPASYAGKQLLAHELTHVIQQSRGLVHGATGSGGLRIGDPGDPFEHHAEQVARGIHGQPAAPHRLPLPAMPATTSSTIQRRPARSSRKAPAASRPAPIIDIGPLAPGQMHRAQFLGTLRDTLMRECEAELAPFGRTSRECPYILRTIERYASRPMSDLMRIIRLFGKPPAGADAQGLIRAVTQRARIVARRVAERRGQRLQASTADGGALPPHDPVAVRSQLQEGRPLEGSTRRHMEDRFGTTFDSVRVHADSAADSLSSALGARAFTVGSDIAFAAGNYRPGTAEGDALIAHELAHTVQQGSRGTRQYGGPSERELEQQAERAAGAAVPGGGGVAGGLPAGDAGLRVQRWPVVAAGVILTAEVGTEAVVVSEIAIVSTEIIVADGVLIAGAEIAVPAALEIAAPAAIETLAPLAVEATVATTEAATFSTAAATVGVGVAATTLSSDSPTSSEPEKKDRRQRCFEQNLFAIPCEYEISMEEQVQDFLLGRGYGFESLGACSGRTSHAPGTIAACNGAPGESWHCDVAPHYDPIARRQYPGGIVSIFSCLCCRADGNVGFEWKGPHWSPGSP